MPVHVYSSKEELEHAVGPFITERANKAIADHGYFAVGFSGGSSATIVCSSLLKMKDIDWNKWRVFLCDERYVPLDDGDSNYKVIYSNLFSKVCSQDCLSQNLFAINPSLSLEEASKDYSRQLGRVFGDVSLPSFDLLLLGMGPDGHTCSLFPGHPLLDEKEKWVAPISDAPKPPPERITLTFPVINNSSCAMFIAAGSGKAAMVKQTVDDKDMALPATRVSLARDEVHWFLDKGSAELLPGSS